MSSDGTDDRDAPPAGGFPPPPPPPGYGDVPPPPGYGQQPQPPLQGQAPPIPQGQMPPAPPYGQTPSAPPYGQQPGYAYPSQPPYSTQGYPGSGPHQPYPSGAQPAGAPAPSGGQPPKKGIGAGAVIGIVAGSLVIVVGIIAAIVLVSRFTGGPTASGEEAPATSTPAGVVQGYLDALAASDAETALSFVSDPPPASAFLTDEALAASNERAPITDIEVTEPEDQDFSTYVTATYSVGDEPVTTEFSVNEYETEGSWKMTAVTADLSLGSRFDGLDITLNGLPVDSDSVQIFPGAYELATTTANFAITGETLLTVRGPFDYPSLSDTNAGLTEEGVLVFRQAVKDAVAACIASKNLVAGCGLDLPQVLDDGSRLAEGTLSRSLDAETQAKLDSLVPQETFGDPLVVSGGFLGGISVNAGLEGGGTGDLLFGPSLGAPVVDFTTGAPVVRWD